MESEISFGGRVRARREALGMSQDDLAQKVGVSQVAIAKIEGGGNTRYGRRLAIALGVSLEELETGALAAGPAPAPAPHEAPTESKTAHQ